MVTLSSLWLPILLSAVFVFVVSSIIHMATPWHKGDVQKVPDQDKVQDALRPFAIPPGDYMLPRCDSMADMKSPEFNAKLERGPVAVMTVLPNGGFKMGKSLVLWFLYSVVISAVASFLLVHTVDRGGACHRIFGIAGITAFLGYSAAIWQSSIWWGRSWATTIRSTIDGAIYAAVTAATLCWLWPH
jgi:hypothetical protein